MMGIVVPETCWAYKKYNKIISSIYLVIILQSSQWRTVQQTPNESVDLPEKYQLVQNYSRFGDLQSGRQEFVCYLQYVQGLFPKLWGSSYHNSGWNLFLALRQVMWFFFWVLEHKPGLFFGSFTPYLTSQRHNVKLSTCTPLRHTGGAAVLLHPFLTSALDGSELSTSCPVRFFPRNDPLSGPLSWTGRFGEKKYPVNLPGFENRTVQPVAHTIYQIRYPAHQRTTAM